jgi:cyanate lyase
MFGNASEDPNGRDERAIAARPLELSWRQLSGNDLEVREDAMKRSDVTERILDIKREKGWKWKDICQKIGGYSEMLIVGALLGQMKLTKPQAAKAAELFGLSKSEEKMLNEVPMRGANVPMPPTDP